MRRSTAAVGSALFFLLAPGVVVGLVPWALTGGWQVREPLPYWAPARMLGGVVLLAGVIVLVQAFVRFVRNPMYVAVLAAIVGQALLLGRLGLLVYAGGSWLVFAAFVRFYEEPALARRFGADYEAYRRGVPAWWPRLRPWEAGGPDEPGAG